MFFLHATKEFLYLTVLVQIVSQFAARIFISQFLLQQICSHCQQSGKIF